MLISEKLVSGIGLTIVGMGVVFVTLLLVSFALDALRVLSAILDKKNHQVPKEAAIKASTAAVPEEDHRALVAVITAAVADFTNTVAGDFVVRSIQPLPQEDTSWGLAGRKQQMEDRLMIYNRRENKHEEIYRSRRWKSV